MMQVVGQVHASLDTRESQIREGFKEDQPAFAVSCDDGMLIVTLNDNRHRFKLKRVFETVAFAGVGVNHDCDLLYRASAAAMKIEGYVNRSANDALAIRQVIDNTAQEIRQKFRNLLSNEYYECELLFSVVGADKKQDLIFNIDCTGYVDFEPSWTVIPSSGGIYMTLLAENGSGTMQSAFRNIAKAVKDKKEKNRNAFFEAVTLSREMVLASRPQDAYRRLGADELEEWLK